MLLKLVKEIWTDASRVLFEATRNSAYFRKIKILVPTTWNTTGPYDVAGTESYNQVGDHSASKLKYTIIATGFKLFPQGNITLVALLCFRTCF